MIIYTYIYYLFLEMDEQLIARLMEKFDKMDDKFDKMDERFTSFETKLNTPEKKIQVDTPYTNNDFLFPSADLNLKASKRDRESLSRFQDLEERLKQELEDSEVAEKLGDSLGDSRSTMITEVIIKDEDKYSTITLYTVRNAMERVKFIRKNSAGGKRIKLVHMFTKKALNKMLSVQQVLGSIVANEFKSGTALLDASDATIYQLCADCLRPESEEDYWVKLFEEVNKDRFSAEFEVRNFHKKLMKINIMLKPKLFI